MGVELFRWVSSSIRRSAIRVQTVSKQVEYEDESGFTLLELTIVMGVIGLLAAAGLSAYSSFRERTLKAEADAAWQELSMAVNLYRIGEGEWPKRYTHALNVGHVTGPWGALAVNLAPWDDAAAETEQMVGAPPNGGPTSSQKTGHLVLENGEICVWVEGLPSSLNNASCPTTVSRS